ncbi:MAG TPA: hypothetical protein VD828_01320, partial [Candidatus Nitrosotenuis sp.]|nr:hypothetical protein [Candidatus Nitrosotenuis sp.]
IDTLRIEKEILTKTISRLYTDSPDLTKIQRDKLLLRYQHQLGVILSKIEKLEQASKHPDLGPLGDGLITLMDQKLSALDKKLVEISTKISVAQIQLEKPEIKKEEPKKEAKIIIEKPIEKPEITSAQNIEEIIQSFAKPSKRLEITTLTEIPSNVSVIPPIETKPTIQSQAQTVAQPQVQIPQVEIVQQITQPDPAKQEIIETIQPQIKQQPIITEPIDIEKQVKSEPPKLEFRNTEPSQEPEKKKSKINIPEPEEIEDDEDDLDSIKREIMKTLSKLEQAEVE